MKDHRAGSQPAHPRPPAVALAGFALALALALALAFPAMVHGAGPERAAERTPAREVGDRVTLRVEDLPAPGATPTVSNTPLPVERPAGRPLRVPPGFTATLFRDGVENARNLLVLPDGGVLVAQQKPGTLTLLHDRDGDGAAEEAWLWAAGFDRPFGLAFHGGFVLVADAQAVWRLPWREGATAAAGERRRLTPPGALGGSDGHDTRSLVLAPDGTRFYVGIGSASDVAEEEAPRATIQEFAADGGQPRTVATGLRNPVGMAFRPGSEDLYVVVNERDGLGDGLVPDFLTRVEPDGFYGWPYAYLGGNPQPGLAERRPDLVARTLVPDLLFEAHSAPLGLVFAERTGFPQRWRNGAFVALHGSSSRSRPVGYTVVFVPFEGRRPAGGYELFAAGFRLDHEGDGPRPVVWGRPSGLAVGKDGSLLVAESLGSVWRIAYGSGRRTRR